MSGKAGVVLNCRTCTRACKQHKALLDEIEIGPDETTTLASMLNFCSSLSFEPKDGASMPQHICLQCLQLLEQAFNFKRMVIDSDELLRLGLNEVHPNEEYVMIEMFNQDQDADATANADDVSALVETLSDPPDADAEYVVEMVAETEVLSSPDGAIELNSVHEYQPADVEYVTIKTEYSREDEDDIEVMDCPGDETSEQMLEEFVAIHDSDELDHLEEHLIPGDSEDADGEGEGDVDADPDNEYLEESMDSTQLLPGEVLAHVCNVCGKEFRQQCRLNQHMRSHVDEKLYSCEVCDKKLKHLRNYKEHMLTHTNLKPHQCNICQRFYRTTSSLAAHKRTHAEDKPYKCEQCGRTYAAFDHLRRHKLTHTGERPYACDLCDKAYYDSSSLRQHKISHTGEKAFTCEICGVGLSQKSGYKKHMLVHSGEKPHKCHICGRAFTFTSNLNAHVRLHSGEKPFKCDKCLKAFPTKKRLNSHLRVHNKDDPVTTAGSGQTNRRSATQKDHYRSLPDVPDQQVSTSKVVVVL